MDITPVIQEGAKTITGYGNGGFKINNAFVEGSLLVFPERMLAWDIDHANHMTAEHFQPVLEAGSVELLLIGTGEQIVFLDTDIRQAFKCRNIAIDVMDTGAACRTYNVLLAEGRKIAAALIAV